ncbi:MAG: hypothetical protein AAGA29_08625 [Planctomycetota bacterium]
MKRTTLFSVTAFMLGAMLLLGGCHYDSSSYYYDRYDTCSDGYHTGYVITEPPRRTRVRRHYSTGYTVGHHTGYHGGGGYISIGHTSHYGYSGCHTGYRHRSYHHGHHSTHRPHYGHHGHGSIHIGGYYCD